MYSILGDSWIAHLSRHVQQRQPDRRIYDTETKWIGISGLTCAKITDMHIAEAASEKPEVVILHVGGNDLASMQLPTIVATNVLTIREKLLKKGAKRVMVTEVPPRDLLQKRDYFRTPFTVAEKEWHAQALLTLNEVLQSKLGLDFLRITKKVRFPKHYGRDGVHLTPDGNQAFFYCLVRGIGYTRN